MGPELMDSLRKQAERFGAELVTDDVLVEEISIDDNAARLNAGVL